MSTTTHLNNAKLRQTMLAKQLSMMDVVYLLNVEVHIVLSWLAPPDANHYSVVPDALYEHLTWQLHQNARPNREQKCQALAKNVEYAYAQLIKAHTELLKHHPETTEDTSPQLFDIECVLQDAVGFCLALAFDRNRTGPEKTETSLQKLPSSPTLRIIK